jgi:hypothetical protein
MEMKVFNTHRRFCIRWPGRKIDGLPACQRLFGRDARLRPGQIQQHQVGALLQSFEDDFAAVRGEVEIAHVEVGRKVGQLPFRPRIEIDAPKILMLNLSTEANEGSPSR